jgi:hypothetical protein
MVIFFGYIIDETTAPLQNKRAFMGIEAHTRIPIEVAAMAFIGAGVASHTLLIVDSFQEMSKTEAKNIADGKAALKAQLGFLQQAFGFEVDIKETSSFMETQDYNAVYKDVEKQVIGSELEVELRKSLPEGERDLTFALSEVAVTRYMRLEHGMDVKIGQRREKLYDVVIGEVAEIDFAYLHDFYAFGTGNLVKTPYKPSSGADNGGKRITLGMDAGSIEEIIKLGPLHSQEAIARIGFAAAALKGIQVPEPKEQAQLQTCLKYVLGVLIREYELSKVKKKFRKYE